MKLHILGLAPFHIHPALVPVCLQESRNGSSFTWGDMNKGKLKSRSILMQSQGKKKKTFISYHNIARIEVELKENLLIQTRELKEYTYK